MNVIQGFIELTAVSNEMKFMQNVDYIVGFHIEQEPECRTIVHIMQQDMTGATYQELRVKESYQQVKDLISMASQAGSTQVHI